MAVNDIANSNFWQSVPEFLGTTEDEQPNRQISWTQINKKKQNVGQKLAEDCNNVMMLT